VARKVVASLSNDLVPEQRQEGKQLRPLTRRRFLGFTIAGACTAFLAACGGATDTPAPAATKSGGAQVIFVSPTSGGASVSTSPAAGGTPIASSAATSIPATRTALKGKITIGRQPASPLSNGQDDPGNQIFQTLIDRYVKDHPGVQIEWLRVPGASFDELTAWVKTRQAAKNVPTLVGSHATTTSSQEATKTSPWISMSPYLDKPSAYTNKPWKEDFPADALAYIQSSLKELYSVTLTAYKATYLYNKNLWKKAGLTEADEPKTWPQFFTVLDKLKGAGTIPMARAGDAFSLSHVYNVTVASISRKQWLEMSGGTNFASDQTRFSALCSGKWKMDVDWNRKAAETTKRLFAYFPPGSTTLKAADIEQLFLTQKAVLWQGTPANQGQTILRRVDEAKAEGLESFEVGAFPTPQPDAATFGEELAKNAAPIADDGERGLQYMVAAADLRQEQDAGAEAVAIDFLQWMTTPAIQAEYVKPSYDLPINPSVKLDDPRLQLFYKNPTQLFPTYFYYGNRPDWIPNFQAYLLGQKDIDTYVKDQQAEILAYAQKVIRESKLDIACP
jgi:hypothetical protein